MAFKYNPGMLDDPELIRAFVVRNESLGLILEALRDNSASSGANRHLLIVGPRGSGKTMLVRRAAAEVRKDPAYGSDWFPLVFGEEAYPVSTPGEFWLEALFHLADQSGDARWGKAVEDLRRELDEQRLRERALGQLLDFAAEQGKRLLLVVENLNMLCEQIRPEAAWELRHTLTNESRVMLLGTATSRFDEVTEVDRAWFEMFSIHELKPLNHQDCATLWQSVTKEPLVPARALVIRILTGGNPRLVTILAGFAANRPFRELMEQLVHLIDDHTDHFKGHLDALGPQERKVFAAVLDRWDPVSAAEVAELTRLTVNEASTLLGRLVRRGAVEVVEQKKRRKVYQAAERLYNLYYLMRRRGYRQARVSLAVRFMVTYYAGRELVSRLSELAEEACHLPAGAREDHYLAYGGVLAQAPRASQRIVACTPPEFFEGEDAPEFVRRLPKLSLVRKAHALYHAGRFDEAEREFREALKRDPTDAVAWGMLGLVLGKELRRFGDAEEALRRAVELAPKDAAAWNNLGNVLAELGRSEDAEQAHRNAVELEPSAARWHSLGHALVELGRLGEAEEAFRKAISFTPDRAAYWNDLGGVLWDLKRREEAEQASRRAVELEPKNAGLWSNLGLALSALGRPEQAEHAYRNALELEPKDGACWNALGRVLVELRRLQEAAESVRKAVELKPGNAGYWANLGHLLLEVGPSDEAERVWARALELHPKELAACGVHLLELRLRRGVDRRAIVGEAEQWIERSGREARVLYVMASLVARLDLKEGLAQAEVWAREACEKERGWGAANALAWVLAAQARWEEALAASRVVLDAAPSEENAQRSATDFLIQAAAAGHTQEALEALMTSAGAAALEPLAVGLRIFAGESPLVAKEILEIGQDVAERIREVARGTPAAAK